MLRKIFVEDSGETNLITGSTVDMTDFNSENKLASEKERNLQKVKNSTWNNKSCTSN